MTIWLYVLCALGMGGGHFILIYFPNHLIWFQISIGVVIPGTEPRPVGTRQRSVNYTGILIKCPQDDTLSDGDLEVIIGYNGANHYVPCCKLYVYFGIVKFVKLHKCLTWASYVLKKLRLLVGKHFRINNRSMLSLWNLDWNILGQIRITRLYLPNFPFNLQWNIASQ